MMFPLDNEASMVTSRISKSVLSSSEMLIGIPPKKKDAHRDRICTCVHMGECEVLIW